MRQRSGVRSEAKDGDDDDQHALEPGKDELEVSGFLDAEVVEAGNKPCCGNGEKLRPVKNGRAMKDRLLQPGEDAENGKRARQSAGDTGNRSGFGDGKPCPHIKE